MRKLLEFHRSPNSAKARIALSYKGLEYVAEEMSAADRAPMIEAAGWPLTPVLIDGNVVMRDSAAILQYLEANYRDAPSLTPATRDDILSAEAVLANLNPEIARIQWSVSPEIEKPEDERDRQAITLARQGLMESLGQLERRLDKGGGWLTGGEFSLYDIILASNLQPVRPPRPFVEQSPIWAFFDEYFSLGEDRSNVADWIDRVYAWDRPLPPAEVS